MGDVVVGRSAGDVSGAGTAATVPGCTGTVGSARTDGAGHPGSEPNSRSGGSAAEEREYVKTGTRCPGRSKSIAAERHDWFKASRYALLAESLADLMASIQSTRMSQSTYGTTAFSMISTAAARSWPPVITVRAAASHAVRWPAGRSSIAIAAATFVSTMRHRMSRKEAHPPAADRTSSTNANAVRRWLATNSAAADPEAPLQAEFRPWAAASSSRIASSAVVNADRKRSQSASRTPRSSPSSDPNHSAIWAPCDVRSGC